MSASARPFRGAALAVAFVLLIAGSAASAWSQSVSLASGCDVSNPQVAQAVIAPRPELSLEAVLVAALTDHPLIEAARARVEAARGARHTARTWTNPLITYWSENGAFPAQAQPPGVQHEASTYLTVPLEPFFQRPPRERRAEEDVRVADAAFAEARRQVALDASRVFFRVALAQAAFNAADTNRACLEGLVAYTKARVREGATAEGDLIRTEVELERVATNAVLADVELARSRAQLMPLFGDPSAVGDVLRLPSAPALTPLATTALLADFLARARERRPEVAAARARVAGAEAAMTYERSIAVRQIGGTFGMKRIDGQSSMIAGVALSLPVFDRNHGGIERATSEHLAAQHDLAWSERTIAADVQSAYDAWQRLVRHVANLRQSFLDRAEEARSIAFAAYQEGAAPLLQVLDASRTVADAQLIYTRALLAAEQAAFELALAAGDEPIAALRAGSVAEAAAPLTRGGSDD